jgi:WS/DGAT/MGAT family acyltransferase
MSVIKQLSKQDVLFVAGENATSYQHTAGLVVLDSSARPDFNFDIFRDNAIERISQIPHFHWKLHEVPLGLDLPYWVVDENFSYDHHIKRIAVPSPGDRVALAELVAHLYSKHLDRSRPLWEMWFIEGLAGGKFAILQKLHHCLMDGQGAAKLGEIMCDLEPDTPSHKVSEDIASAKAGRVPASWERSARTAIHLARLPGEVTRGMYGIFRPKIAKQLSWNKTSGKEQPALPRTFFNGDIGSDRGFVFGSLPLKKIKTVKAHFDVSVNDVVLALVGSVMRNYLLAQDQLPAESLRASMAVSLRSKADDDFSNKVTTTSVTLATDLDDPAERLRAINRESELAKRQARSGAMGFMEVFQMMPPILINTLLEVTTPEQALQIMGANLILSNVRGSPNPLYIAGVRMETMYPMSVIMHGVGINITCLSYTDQIDFGVTVAPELVPEPWSIIDGLEVALSEYVALTRKKPTRRKKAAARKAARQRAARKAQARPRM